ncbi:uncharacterized protein LOC127834252 isoform X5 [Dreissena polymorpha]|uniref:uncharacterized protein LOC127834252 isoform X4 n=1 Tax=Dreissena polymorpha TaxID=45954 RepID=UPI0022652E8E|nr:uncharacterized protein LOC127834252 isoform X4 [Dreissena polymorpha]XP_052215904.1 uncharacterized protein LOC127834252 isoform X5 [Dreissena polymorpha]
MEKHFTHKGSHNSTIGAMFTLTDVGVEMPWSVLSHFNIVEYLKSENIIVVENKDNTDDARIISTKEKNDLKKIIKKFVTNNIYSKPVQFQSTLAFKLLLVNDTGKLNQNVMVFLQHLCGESVLLYVDIKSQMCYLYSNVINDLLNLPQTIECAIVEMVYTQSEIEYIHAYIEKWYNVAKLIPCCTSGFTTKFVATHDVLDDLDRNAIYMHCVQVSLNETELLVKCHELDTHLIDLSKALSVTVVSLEKQAKLLSLKGTKKSVRELMSTWRNMYIQLETLFNVPVSKVHFINNELQKVSDGNLFSVDITVNAPNKEADVGGKVIASWLNSEGRGIYLVKGDLLALHVDTIIILTTNVLFPLFEAKGFRNDSQLSIKDTKFPIGHVFFSGNTPERCLVVVQNASKRRDDATWDDQLRSCFRNAFQKIAEKGLSKVAIHASVIDETNVPYFLKAFVETSVQWNFVSYICCQSFEEIVPTHNVIQQSLLLGQHNLRRNLRFDNVQGFRKIAVEIREGSIVEQEADVLVNTVDKSLDLQNGQLSKLFYEKAGKEIEDECKQFHPKGLQFGQCAVTSAGLLKKNGVHQILHCALPDYNKTQFEQDIRQMVKLCLLNADLKASKSIAFPSLGMGTLGYPISETQYAMLQAVEEYQFEAVSSNIETVIFVVFEKNKEQENKNYERFLKNRSALFPEHNMKRKRELLTVGFHKIAVKIRKGSIVEQQVDVLVNTVDTSLDLNKGQVSKLIYEHCGKRIQDECHKSCPNGLPQRNCTVTSAGDLAKIGVKRIVHCVLPVFNKTVFEKDVKDLVKLCLMHANKQSCKSIAFPSIGMGKLGYPVLETKYAMLQAVEEYQYEALFSTLETVVFVVLEDDMYEQYLRIQGDGFQPKNKSVLDVGFPGISRVIDTVKIHVTSSLVKNCLPVSAIIFNVTVDDNVGEVDVCLARGHIVLLSSPTHITVKHAIEMCIEAKVMDVVFCICKGTDDTVGSILSAVETSNKKGHVRTVYILLTEQELLEKAQNNYYAWYPLLTAWTKTKDENLQCSMRVMALKEEADDVFTKCQQILSPKESKQDTGFLACRHVSDYEVSSEMVEDPEKHSETQHHQTQPVPDMVEILDSEDEELQIALIESLESSEAIVNLPDIQTDLDPEDNLQSVLKAFQVGTVDKESVTKLLVMRSDVLNTALKGLNRKKINFKSSLYVKFSGEIGEDQGGPRREFFRLALKALQDSGFFEGPETTKIFSHNISLLDTDQYRVIGRLVALSLVHGGPGIHFLHPDLYNLMVGKPSKMEDLEELLPATTCDMLQQLRDADDEDKKDQFLSRYADHLLDLGIPNVNHLVRHEKANLIQIIKKQYIYYRISGEISQFTTGMNDVNLAWDMVKSHAELFEPLFCFHPKEITGEEMIRLFKMNYSLVGSNDRALEDVSVYGWEAFLQSIEAGDIDVTLSEVIAFVTGADCFPPCGFSKLIDVDFYTCGDRLPSASTCALQLWLPRVNNPDMISKLMYRALKESYGFMKS